MYIYSLPAITNSGCYFHSLELVFITLQHFHSIACLLRKRSFKKNTPCQDGEAPHHDTSPLRFCNGTRLRAVGRGPWAVSWEQRRGRTTRASASPRPAGGREEDPAQRTQRIGSARAKGTCGGVPWRRNGSRRAAVTPSPPPPGHDQASSGPPLPFCLFVCFHACTNVSLLTHALRSVPVPTLLAPWSRANDATETAAGLPVGAAVHPGRRGENCWRRDAVGVARSRRP